ncbi:GlxA family transcriptional regulator [Streptomyces violascens]|uniref:AraC family transcriptional regulator n=1 Tax=Streptomyces violascens TaxID=67381 RepID=A0ABQ3QEW5_9ACTN|nr:helix-turn-helix domain-containing protein [Streptomyces violascens]GGU46823.1 AraC family transcriptional regulator [Streptomyces violascens]GHI35833.1 AraC family transcriptional regulator [Streptomyces violascens]
MTWRHQRPHAVVALALPGIEPFDLATAAQVFGFRDEAARYSFTVCGLRPGPVPTSTGFAIDVAAGLDALATADTVIVPGFDPPVEPDAAVLQALRSAHDRGTRLVSVFLGAFVLAAAGLLDGRRATTHWCVAAEFRRRYPSVWLDPDVLFVDGGGILSGAGQSGSVDFYLHVIRSDFGAGAADAVARRMVAATHRPGDHPQDPRKDTRDDGTDHLALTLEWAIGKMHQPLSLARLARHAGMPTRTFSRRFLERTHMTPMRWLSSQRLLEAQRLLETTDLPIDHIAERCGLGTAGNLRLHMSRALGTTPTQYRRAHRRIPHGPPA